jgi:ribosomal protein S30
MKSPRVKNKKRYQKSLEKRRISSKNNRKYK